MAVGYEVTGTGIPAGTTVSQINASVYPVDPESERDRQRIGKPGVHAARYHRKSWRSSSPLEILPLRLEA